MTRPAVFFDRDGVLNHDAGYVFEASKFVWMDGQLTDLEAARAAGIRGLLFREGNLEALVREALKLS
jgi:histidinol phosphatase-like enzyme